MFEPFVSPCIYPFNLFDLSLDMYLIIHFKNLVRLIPIMEVLCHCITMLVLTKVCLC